MVKLKRIDLTKEDEGVWCPHEDGWATKERSWKSRRVQDAFNKEHMSRLADAAKIDPKITKLSDEAFVDLLNWAFANLVLVDWTGIDDPDQTEGKDRSQHANVGGEWQLPFSPANAYALLVDPANRSFRRHVDKCTSEEDRFLEGMQIALGK